MLHSNFQQTGGFSYTDISLKTIVPFGEYDYAKPFGLGRKAIIARERTYGIIDEYGKAGMYNDEGDMTLPFEYDAIYKTSYDNLESEEAKYIVIKEGKVGTVDIHNQVLIPIVYDGLSGWVEYGPDAHFAKKEGKYGAT